MSFWAYMLRCADGSYYVGHTDDLERRIGMHADGVVAGYVDAAAGDSGVVAGICEPCGGARG